MHRRPSPPRRANTGFTLLECLIVTAIAGVLSSLAYPSFESVVQRARRADALVAMMQVQLVQERWRANHAAYGSLAEVGATAAGAGRHYTLQLNSATRSAYEVIATATGAQSRDTACRVLVLVVSGMQPSYRSGADANADNDAATNRRCWSL